MLRVIIQQVLEHVITNGVAHGDAIRLVKLPVDSQVDAALAIFLRRLAEARVVADDTGELIGRKAEGELSVP